MLGTIANTLIMTEDYSIDIPDFISKKEFGTVLNVFEDIPVIDTIDAETFAQNY